MIFSPVPRELCLTWFGLGKNFLLIPYIFPSSPLVSLGGILSPSLSSDVAVDLHLCGGALPPRTEVVLILREWLHPWRTL